MRETGTTYWHSLNSGATNSSGFTSLPGGRNEAFTFFGLTYGNFFWSSSLNDTWSAWLRDQSGGYVDGYIHRGCEYLTDGYSIRRIRNSAIFHQIHPNHNV